MQLTLEAWKKPRGARASRELGTISLEVGEKQYRELEKLEKQLRDSEAEEKFLTVNPAELNLQTPQECGQLNDCRLRLYLRDEDDSGHFHLVGQRAADNALVYTNAVMVRTMAI